MAYSRAMDEVRAKNGLKGAAKVFVDLTGKTLGNWTVLHLHSKGTARIPVRWLCRCVCGKERTVISGSLLTGRSKGCSCVRRGLRLRSYESLYNIFCKQKKHPLNFEL